MPRRMFRSAAIVATAALTFAPVAAGKAGDRSFSQTYPHASTLCAKAAAGTLPKKLAPSTSQVLTACGALHTNFNSSVTTVQTAQTAYTNGLATAKATRDAACNPPPVNHKACRAARIVYRAAVKNLRATHKLAVKAYYVSIENARRTFWATIRVLRGGSVITPDSPIAPHNS